MNMDIRIVASELNSAVPKMAPTIGPTVVWDGGDEDPDAHDLDEDDESSEESSDDVRAFDLLLLKLLT